VRYTLDLLRRGWPAVDRPAVRRPAVGRPADSQ
jgi:hypothetical protein